MTVGRALARVGLLGNPSDGYGGRVLATTLPQFEATVAVTPSSSWDCGGFELLEATVASLRQLQPQLVTEPATLSFTTTVPRQVGLAGSSAIIIAALRALGDRAGFTWDRVELAKTALYVETDTLGWAAGPQDRVVQAFEGLVDMDFAIPWRSASYERVDPGLLPTLFVAWSQSMGEPSDIAHTQVRERWLAGDSQVVSAMASFAALAASGRSALGQGTAAEEWPTLLNRSFDLRSSIWNITAVDETLITTGQQLGAGVGFAGSGGAVVGCPADPTALEKLADSYRRIGAGFQVIKP